MTYAFGMGLAAVRVGLESQGIAQRPVEPPTGLQRFPVIVRLAPIEQCGVVTFHRLAVDAVLHGRRQRAAIAQAHESACFGAAADFREQTLRRRSLFGDAVGVRRTNSSLLTDAYVLQDDFLHTPSAR
jgi:hypothetical protein